MRTITIISVLIIIFISLSFRVEAQTTMDVLRSKKWVWNGTQEGESVHTVVTFTEDRMLQTVVYMGHTRNNNLPYRLSDDPDKSILISRRSVAKSGKYLLSAADGALVVWEITSISKDSLQLKPYGTNTIVKLVAKPL